MTKKHYEAIARTFINASYNTSMNAQQMRETLALMQADFFESDNKLFDRARFLQACGIETK